EVCTRSVAHKRQAWGPQPCAPLAPGPKAELTFMLPGLFRPETRADVVQAPPRPHAGPAAAARGLAGRQPLERRTHRVVGTAQGPAPARREPRGQAAVAAQD